MYLSTVFVISFSFGVVTIVGMFNKMWYYLSVERGFIYIEYQPNMR